METIPTSQSIHLEAIRWLVKHPDMKAYIFLLDELVNGDLGDGISPETLKGLIMVDVEDTILRENLATVERRAVITDRDFKTAVNIAQLKRRK
jgi:hypothetical protein